MPVGTQGSNAFAWVATLDTSDVSSATQLLADNFTTISNALFNMEKHADNNSFAKAINQWTRAQERVERLNKTLIELRAAQDALNASGNQQVPADQFGARAVEAVHKQRGGKGAPPKVLRGAELGKAVEEVKAGIEGSTQAMDEFGRSALQNASAATEAFGGLQAQVNGFRQTMEQLTLLLEGGLNAKFILTASQVIEQEILKIKSQMADLDEVVSKQRDLKTQARRSQADKLTVRSNAALERAARLERTIVGLKEQQLLLAQQGVVQTQAQRTQLAGLRTKQDAANKEARQLASEASDLNKAQAGDRTTAGISEEYDELAKNLVELEKRQQALFDPEQTDKQQQGLAAQRHELEAMKAAIDGGNLSDQERNRLLQEASIKTKQLLADTERLAREAAKGAQALGDEDLTRAKQKQLPGINRLFTNISKDLSRRFIATLQFAVSGALIFGIQKFVREFIKGAVEVERAFKDIESALEFDIDAPRGALEFRLEVEQVRREILLLANDFNVLPTEANKAAFVMISRFQDTGNALKALRAHLLATKVSTIDQAETLRALTAVAEGFTASILEVNESMTLQESLFRRETVSANLYIQALDLAVQIQQKFGVEVEDTLEGGARATEVFRQMGFTMEETFAIVAATSRQLGQTGQQVAERLNRSLGQLTDPKIRDALLALSGTTKEFTLQISDFESGATAWKKIADEFQRLEKSSPAAARQILQIVGQRRELEAVAAALGTADLQEAIVTGADKAVGSALTRFSFLTVTVSEMFKSIATGMEELAQNFERLGGLNTFKILLIGVDKFVSALNDALKFLLSIRDAMDRAFNNGILGTLVFQVAALTLALGGTLRILFEIKRVYDTIAKSQTFGAAAKFFALGEGKRLFGAAADGGVLAAGIASSRATFAAASTAGGLSGVAAGTGAVGAVVGIKAAAGIKAAHAALTAFIPVWGQVAIGALILGVAMQRAGQRTKAFAEDFDRWINGMATSMNDLRKEAARLGLTGAEHEQFLLRGGIRSAEDLREGAASNTQDQGMRFLREFTGASGESVFPGANLGQFFRELNTPSSIEGHSEGIQLAIDRMNRQLFTSIADELQRQVDTAEFDDADKALLEVLQKSGNPIAQLLSAIGGSDPIAVAREFMNTRIAEAMELANRGGTEDQRRENVVNADAIIGQASNDFNDFMRLFGELPDQLIRSVEQLNTELGHLPTQVSLGEIAPFEASRRTFEIAAELRDRAAKLRDDVNGPADIDAADSADRDAEEATLAYLEGRKTIMNNYIRNATRFLGPREALVEEAARITREIEDLIKRGFGRGAFREQSERLLDIAKEQAEEARQTALDEAQLAVSLSRNFEARRESMEAQIRLLKIQAIQVSQNTKLAAELRAQAGALQLALDKEVASEEIRLVIAKFRAHKNRDPITELEAQIKGLQEKQRSEFSSNADRQEATNAIVDALRAIQLAEIQKLTAVALSRVSVRDSINEQLVALSGLKQEVLHAINVYGLSSKAHLDLARTIKQSEAALLDAVLDMESVNRQLSSGFDVTNPLHKAEEDFIRISRELQIPDLGDAERAAKELELKNSEAARISASFNDGMFNLKFQFERGTIGQSEYISALRGMLDATDLTTTQGMQLWMQINSLIEGLTDDLSGAAFNIPGQIRIPTLFEVRRAVQAEALGVNYVDNRQQDIHVHVSSDLQLSAVLDAIEGVFEVQAAAMAPGGAGITLGAPNG